ncbi:hypothetical protein [Psychroflexus sp. ALD_RP9]|uniref:hypothetical protein n=1 Tax=Psychroflexus sp. ALD_RP9 TaxID=2777186 RepID=UPI001A8CE909|nr:hypothetical protein [Psychroflexus sp. ALD_RP9]QSS97695.1 hypothetical protein IMZ30_03005 [Psychroflexus sp. ALD_RP9]
MKQKKPILVLVSISAILFLVHQYLQNETSINIAFLNNYLDPFLLMPLLLYAVLWERRMFLKDKSMVLSYTEIFGYFLLMVILGEVLFPYVSKKFTADYWDILAYALGTLAYIIAKKFPDLKKIKTFIKKISIIKN